MNRNKITELPNNEDIIIGDFSLGRVGEPMGVFYAHKALGVYSKDEDNVYILPNGQKDQVRKGASTGAPFKGGDMIWEDIDGNGLLTTMTASSSVIPILSLLAVCLIHSPTKEFHSIS